MFYYQIAQSSSFWVAHLFVVGLVLCGIIPFLYHPKLSNHYHLMFYDQIAQSSLFRVGHRFDGILSLFWIIPFPHHLQYFRRRLGLVLKHSFPITSRCLAPPPPDRTARGRTKCLGRRTCSTWRVCGCPTTTTSSSRCWRAPPAFVCATVSAFSTFVVLPFTMTPRRCAFGALSLSLRLFVRHSDCFPHFC